MSDQHPGQYKAKAFTFEEFTQIFRNSFLLHIFYAGYAASISWTLHTLVFSAATDSDVVTVVVGGLLIAAFLALAVAVTNSAWRRICERREIEFLVSLIEQKYDTTGMVFDDRFGHFDKVTGIRTSTDGSKPIDVMFIFDPRTKEPLYFGSFAGTGFYPTPLFPAKSSY
jgi:hypothetical protein